MPGAFPDLDLLGRIAADPRASLNLLADALPRIIGADWALVLSPEHGAGVLARSWDAPADAVLPDLPPQASAVTIGSSHYATAPVGSDRRRACWSAASATRTSTASRCCGSPGSPRSRRRWRAPG